MIPRMELCNGMLNSVFGRALPPRPGNRQFVPAAVQHKATQFHRLPISRNRESSCVDTIDVDREIMIRLSGRSAVGHFKPEFDALVQRDHEPRHWLIGLKEGFLLERIRR